MRHLIAYFLELGMAGLLLMGILDSSFLFIPTGNDLLLILLTARHHENVVAYVLAASVGSLLGVLLLDLVSRKGGEEGLKRILSHKRLAFAKGKIKSNAAIMLVAAALSPPPFPFTAVVATASAFQYPRRQLLSVVFAGRLLRFGILGWIAILFGRHIVAIMRSSEFWWAIAGFSAICVIGSIFSVTRWIRAGKQT
jgi:membrane protein YqaA with SNARE-associated domain